MNEIVTQAKKSLKNIDVPSMGDLSAAVSDGYDTARKEFLKASRTGVRFAKKNPYWVAGGFLAAAGLGYLAYRLLKQSSLEDVSNEVA